MLIKHIDDLLQEEEKVFVQNIFESKAVKPDQKAGWLMTSFLSVAYVYFTLKKSGLKTQCCNLKPLSNSLKINSVKILQKAYEELKEKKNYPKNY
jgi:hypothetical protein